MPRTHLTIGEEDKIRPTYMGEPVNRLYADIGKDNAGYEATICFESFKVLKNFILVMQGFIGDRERLEDEVISDSHRAEDLEQEVEDLSELQEAKV